MKLLEIQSSVRGKNSLSRQLSRIFIEAWQAKHSEAEYKLRDVGLNPAPHINEQWTVANYTPTAERTESMQQQLEFSNDWKNYLLQKEPSLS